MKRLWRWGLRRRWFPFVFGGVPGVVIGVALFVFHLHARLWKQIDRLSDWVGPHLGARSAELTIVALVTVALLVAVHTALMAIMGYQRPWERLQRAMFWWVGTKAALWAYLLYMQVRTVLRFGLIGTYPFRFLVLLVAVDVTSMWVLWEMDRRYRRGREG